MFEMKLNPTKDDVVVSMPAQFLNGQPGKLVAKKEALQLVAYIQSLKQTPLPEGTTPPEFLYKRKTAVADGAAAGKSVDGKALYTANCAACHQANGEGLQGAFPSLKGSKIVIGDNLELYVDIIMNGYDATQQYGVMASVGTNMEFTEFDVAAIINYERNSWGNKGKEVTPEEIKKIIDLIKIKIAADQ
jgi:cytochrome c oxidase cbb3-type subunit 2